jgi:hypothetical protein
MIRSNHFHDYAKLDQKLCQLAGAIETNVLAYISPQNLSDEKKKFFDALEKNEQYNPVFSYIPRNPIFSYFNLSPTFSTYKLELKELLSEIGDDSLDLIFEKKIIDLFDRMEMLRSVGTENFAGNAESYYGGLDNATVRFAKEFLLKNFEPEEKNIQYNDAKIIIEAFLKKKRLSYKVSKKETAGSKFSVNIRTKEILINPNHPFSSNSLKRLIAHEIEGHIYRYENGLNQPYKIFSRGLSRETLETEEGLAVYVEQQQGINIDSQLKEYSGRVLAISTAMKHTFHETFIELRKYFSDEDAFNITVRAKRGVYKQDQGGAFTKDALYLKGMLLVKEFLTKQPLGELYFGRYATSDTPLVLDIDGLIKPKYMPEFTKSKKQ